MLLLESRREKLSHILLHAFRHVCLWEESSALDHCYWLLLSHSGTVNYSCVLWHSLEGNCVILQTWFCSVLLAVLDPRVGHTMDVLSPFIPVLCCHSDCLFHGESCPRLDVVHPGRAWPSSPSCTWHCSLYYLFLQATPLFPHGVTIVC